MGNDACGFREGVGRKEVGGGINYQGLGTRVVWLLWWKDLVGGYLYLCWSNSIVQVLWRPSHVCYHHEPRDN